MGAPILAAVDVYGTRRPEAEVLSLIELVPGTSAEDPAFHRHCQAQAARLRADGRWSFADLSGINYFAGPEAGRTYVTVDLVDRGDERRMAFAPEPTGHIDDPAGLVAAWREYDTAAWALLREGKLDLDAPRGPALHYALGFGHPSLTAYEERFVREVPVHFDALERVLREDRDLHRRGAAAFLLAYGPDAQAVVDAELAAVRDPQSFVRNNTMRVLVELPERAKTAVTIDVEPLLDALDFPATTDRNKASFALLMIARREPATHARIREHASNILRRMTRLKQPNNREVAIELLQILG